MKKFIIAALFFLTCLPVAIAEGLGPKATIENTINEIVKVVETYPGDANLRERRAKLREIINPQFDFGKMAQLSLGTNWPEITAEQQQEFVSVFSDLLAKTYLTKIETIKAGMVSIETESLDSTGAKATVKTLVKSKGDVFPIDYKLLNVGGIWKAYDVVIENIGLVVNYRNEFTGLIRKEKFEGLMKKLREKAA